MGIKHTLPGCHYRVSAKWLIRDTKERFLLVREANGLWELPGGGIDHGEDPRNALSREISEEMGLAVTSTSPVPLFVTTSLSMSGNPIMNLIYEIEVEHLEFTPSQECQEIGFFDVFTAGKLPLFPNIPPFLEQLSTSQIHQS